MSLWDDAVGAVADVVETVCDAIGATGEAVGNAIGDAMDTMFGEGSGDGAREAGSDWNDRWHRIGDVLHDLVNGVGQSVEYTLMTRHRISTSCLDRSVSSIPKLYASSFNNAVVETQFSYNDSGTRFQFRINEAGNVEFREKEETGDEWRLLAPPSCYPQSDYNGNVQGPVAISYTTRRGKGRKRKNEHNFHMYTAPRFDMIAADGSRVFAKQAGKDNFYVTTMEHEYLHYASHHGQSPVHVPGFEFKLDSEYNQETANPDDLGWWTDEDYNSHPSVKMYKRNFLPFAKLTALQDIMMVRAEPRVWHLLDTRPPCGSGKPPRWVRTYDHVTYQDLGPLQRIKDMFGYRTRQPSIKFLKVIDIGVGNMHRYTHYEEINGGEMQNGPDTAFTGPTKDRAGFWDGTCNFYILCQLKSDIEIQRAGHTRDAFAILWIDHQTYFSERWRLVHPEDNFAGLFRDWALVGAVKSLLPWIRESHRFYRDKFWCPFRSGCVDSRSRMAVSRQTIVVTGIEEIYSINFSWGSMDRTWRWRPYPPGTALKYLSSDDIAAGRQVVRIDEKSPNSVYPQTIALREDMTIYIMGTKEIGGEVKKGYWYQKYLPADNLEVPDEVDRNESGRPATGYCHPWHFMTEEIFAVADSYSHFGIYKTVDSRSQYYNVTIEDYQDIDELIGRRLIDPNDKLQITEHISGLIHKPPSLFNSHTWLTFTRGFSDQPIVIWWDKKDDDLMCLDNLKDNIVLQSDDGEGRQIRLRLNSNIRVWHPPVVNKVRITLNGYDKTIEFWLLSRMENPPRCVRDQGEAAVLAWTPQSDNTIMRIKVYVWEGGQTRVIFAKSKVDFSQDGEFAFFYVLDCQNQNVYGNMARYFCEPFCYEVGTSVVIEGILGHVVTPEQIEIVTAQL